MHLLTVIVSGFNFVSVNYLLSAIMTIYIHKCMLVARSGCTVDKQSYRINPKDLGNHNPYHTCLNFE